MTWGLFEAIGASDTISVTITESAALYQQAGSYGSTSLPDVSLYLYSGIDSLCAYQYKAHKTSASAPCRNVQPAAP